ncbi:MAG TPA: hypothetical protein VE914_18935 [Candidatus Angelobacter sp.]|nr:hypothetical protein [Candidatus Angelobacter sp.]
MNQAERDLVWSKDIANSVIEELVRGNVLREADWARAEAIAAQQIYIHLISGDRPEGYAPPTAGIEPK